MTFYICPISYDTMSIDNQMANLDKAKALIESKTDCKFSKRMYPRTRSASDQYTTNVSGFAFIDYLDDVIGPLVRQHECEVYW